ncbi:MAG TPA: outer membrane beta-barrel domain-containing protein [Dongiaceae bacterium]|nr:outer membrane beta-barrel domain-containing protein [Dongiaceae bacterium]
MIEQDLGSRHARVWLASLAIASALTLVAVAACTADPEPGAPADSAAAVPSPLGTPTVATASPDTTALPPGAMPTTRVVKLVHATRNVVRSGPGEEYSIVGVYPKGTVLPVIAKRGDWYGVRLSPDETGWIHSSLCKESDDVSDLEFRANPKLYSRMGSYLLTAYAGGYAFDRKSNSLALGGGLGYYVFDRMRVDASVGWTHVHRPAEIVESLFALSLEAEDFHMLYYHVTGSWEILPGRQLVPYLTAGAGASIMQGESDPSWDFGVGAMIYLSKKTAMRWEVRDYRFTSGDAKAKQSNDNIELSVGTALLF